MTVSYTVFRTVCHLGKDYGDEAAVNDTAAEVRALQRKGICVSAVFMGTDAGALKAANNLWKRIYQNTGGRTVGQGSRFADPEGK